MSKTTSKYLGCAVVLAAAVVAAPSGAATICVDPAGGSCLTTIQAAVTAALAGDTVSIKPGYYNENITVPIGKDGLIIKGGKKAVIDPDAPLNGDGLTIDSDDVTVTGLTIRNGQSAGIVSNGDDAFIKGVTISGPDGDCIEVNGSDTVVAASTLIGCGDSAVDASADFVDVFGNKISHCGSECVEIAGNSAIVENNKIKLADGDGVDVTGDTAEILKNKVSMTDGTGINVSGDNGLIQGNKVSDAAGVGVDVSGQNPVVTKNTAAYMYDGEGVEVDCDTDCSTALVVGNRVSNVFDDSGGIFVTGDAAGMLVEKNAVSDVEDNAYDVDGNGSVTFQKNKSKRNGGDAGDEHCIFVDGTGGHQILGNRVEDCHGDGINATGTNHVIAGNDFRNLIESGIVVDGASSGITVDDNKVTNANGIGLRFNNTVTTSTADGNKLKSVRMGLCNDSASTTVTNTSTSKAATPDQIGGACPSF